MVEGGKDLPARETEQDRGGKHARHTQIRSERRVDPSAAVHAPVWAPQMVVDDQAVTTDASIRGSDSGTAACIADALEQALLLPEDMGELRRMRDHNVFMMLKKELAMVRISIDCLFIPTPFIIVFLVFSLCSTLIAFVRILLMTFICRLSNLHIRRRRLLPIRIRP